MSIDWLLRVWTPTGGGPRIIERDHTFIRSTGLRMKVTPEGDGVEASFDARGDGLLIPPLSAVQVVHRDGGVETPVYYGQVRQGGNTNDTQGERYVLRSLLLKLKAIPLPVAFSTPKQAAHLTVRAILQAAQTHFNGLILYDETLIPDLGFDALEIKAANGQSAWAFLERLQADGKGLGVDVRLGVRADRKVYCLPARSDTLTLTANQLARVQWNSPEAEDPCTAVTWLVAKRPDGTWVTHETQSAAVASIGYWGKVVAVGADLNPWATVPGTYTARGGTTTLAVPAGDATLLTDTLSTSRYRAEGGTAPESYFPPAIEYGQTADLTFTPSNPVDRLVLDGATYYARDATVSAGGTQVTQFSGLDGISRFNATLYRPIQAGTPVKVQAEASSYATTYTGAQQHFWMSEFRAEAVNMALLDQLAEFHFRVPAVNPADLEVNAFIPPASLTGRVSAGTYTNPVEAWEYRLSAATGLTTAALAGQADKPEDLARAALIRARDRDATLAALTAQT